MTKKKRNSSLKSHPTSPLKRNRESYLQQTYIIIGLVILIGLIFIAFLNKNQNEKVEKNINRSDTSQLIDTSNWVKYENQELGFTFSYPKEWKLQINELDSCYGNEFSANSCPIRGELNPQSYIDYQQRKYKGLVSSLVYFTIYNAPDNSLDSLYNMFKIQYSSQDGYKSKPSYLFKNNGLKGFYVNQNTNSYSDNLFVIQLSPDIYIDVKNRESDKHYSPGRGRVDDQNDYTQYTEVLNQIIKTIAPLK